MKLYTRGQMILVSTAVFVLTVGIMAFVGFKTVNAVVAKQTSAKEEQINEVSQKENDGFGEELKNSSSEASALATFSDEQSILATDSILETNSAPVIQVSNAMYTQDEIQNISVYDACNEAVVNINTKVMAYDWFLEPYVQDGGSGSGSIIDKRGYILTNVHVIQNATKIYVSLFDGTQYEAEVVGQDLDSDLAVLKFTPPDDLELKTIAFGDSTQLKVGQKVIAIGNPFGMERTMTTGIISGLGRPIQNSNKRIIRNMIQTDTAINPGNSGGPLLDTNGRMIGINTMIMSSSGSSAGVGFAVPSETAVRVVSDLLKYGKVQRGRIDASIIQLNSRIAQYAGLDIASGMLVSSVTKGGNAEKAGMKGGTEAAYYGSRSSIIYLGGDIITKIDDIAVTSLADYYSALESKKPGDVVSVVVRRDKKNVTLKLTLVE